MAFTYGFYNSRNGDRKYYAEQMAMLVDGLITNGVFMTVGDQFMVKPSSGMSVSVGTGHAWYDATWSHNDSELIMTAEQSDLLLDRIDALVLEVDKTETTRANAIKWVTGAPSTNPVKPALTFGEYLRQRPIAYIRIPANSTAIKAENIENCVGTSACPFVTGVLEGMDIDNLVAQWEAQFIAWFEKMKDQLDEDAAGNLQNQIDNNTWLLEGGTEIPEGADLNTYLIPGNYYVNMNVERTTLSNCPTNMAFVMKVYNAVGRTADDHYYRTQELRELKTGAVYIRTVESLNGGATWIWGEWFVNLRSVGGIVNGTLAITGENDDTVYNNIRGIALQQNNGVYENQLGFPLASGGLWKLYISNKGADNGELSIAFSPYDDGVDESVSGILMRMRRDKTVYLATDVSYPANTRGKLRNIEVRTSSNTGTLQNTGKIIMVRK